MGYRDFFEYVDDGEELTEDKLNSISEINDTVKGEMASKAQAVYDDWAQDENGEDIDLGRGGICHLIADDLVGVLYKHHINNVQTVCSSYEQHVYMVGAFKEGVYLIDIPYEVYETGGGYTWKKIPDVEFSKSDIVIRKLDGDYNSFKDYVGEF